MRVQESLVFFLVVMVGQTLGLSGCVTQTEQVSPYEQTKNESAWEEIQREFGWQSKSPPLPPGQEPEPFYRRATRGIKDTIAGWFADEDQSLGQQGMSRAQHHFEQPSTPRLPRLRMQQRGAQEEEGE
jgi:hypothetical protein